MFLDASMCVLWGLCLLWVGECELGLSKVLG